VADRVLSANASAEAVSFRLASAGEASASATTGIIQATSGGRMEWAAMAQPAPGTRAPTTGTIHTA